MEDTLPMLSVVGATASGKSELAVALAEALGGEIVNTDSVQIYRRLDVGTGKPDPELLRRVPHHLYDTVEPDAAYSAGRYAEDARACIADIRARGRLPILCGGTGLYLRALLQGIADIPTVPEAVRQNVLARLAAEGAPALHAQLAQVDPDTAQRVHPNDAARVARALEVYQAGGEPLSAYQNRRPFAVFPTHVLSLGPEWERPTLYARINARVRTMLGSGWRDEVQALLEQGYSPALKAMQVIGYREIAQFLGGERPWEGIEAAIAQRTRHYAKRQLTWLRRHEGILWAPPGNEPQLIEAARKFLNCPRQAR